MNYRTLAERIHRPYNTVRKWRGEIAKISGRDFKRIKVRNGRGRKNRTTYDFTETDVENFKKLDTLLQSGSSMQNAITQIFGNAKHEAEQEKEDKLQRMQRLLQFCTQNIETLESKNKNLEGKVSTLQRECSTLTQRIEALENKGFKNIFKK
jgi:predicted RNase H-like nuclease (RuvC/YqgF family)